MNADEIQKVGQFAMETMTHLERKLPDDATVDNVVLLVAIRRTDEDGDKLTGVEYACTDDRGYVQVGIISEGLDAARWGVRGEMDGDLE